MTGAAVYLILGLSLLLATVLPYLTQRIALSPPMVLVAVGMAIGLLPLADGTSLEPQDHRVLIRHVTEFTGTDITISIETSADDAAADPFSERLTFTEVTSGPTAERKTMTSPATQVMERYIRVTTSTTGGFTSCSFVVILTVNESEVTF